MLPTMPEVMSEVIALGFQCVVILVFNLPACASCAYYIDHVMGVDRMITDKSSFILGKI